eukprot:13324381-Ditylum_brightwellii.AAC.1
MHASRQYLHDDKESDADGNSCIDNDDMSSNGNKSNNHGTPKSTDCYFTASQEQQKQEHGSAI